MSHVSLHPLRHVWHTPHVSDLSLLVPRRTLNLLILLAALCLWAFPLNQHSLPWKSDTAEPALAATEPATTTSEPDKPALSPAMKRALDYAARKYRVSAEALTPIFMTAQSAAEEARLDPLLVVAVIAIESRFNPFSQSTMGAQGLMQIIPRYHPEKLPEGADTLALFDPVTNVRVGTRALHEYVQRHGLVSGLQQFAGAADDPEQGYANKVLAEMERMENPLRR